MYKSIVMMNEVSYSADLNEWYEWFEIRQNDNFIGRCDGLVPSECIDFFSIHQSATYWSFSSFCSHRINAKLSLLLLLFRYH